MGSDQEKNIEKSNKKENNAESTGVKIGKILLFVLQGYTLAYLFKVLLREPLQVAWKKSADWWQNKSQIRQANLKPLEKLEYSSDREAPEMSKQTEQLRGILGDQLYVPDTERLPHDLYEGLEECVRKIEEEIVPEIVHVFNSLDLDRRKEFLLHLNSVFYGPQSNPWTQVTENPSGYRKGYSQVETQITTRFASALITGGLSAALILHYFIADNSTNSDGTPKKSDSTWLSEQILLGVSSGLTFAVVGAMGAEALTDSQAQTLIAAAENHILALEGVCEKARLSSKLHKVHRELENRSKENQTGGNHQETTKSVNFHDIPGLQWVKAAGDGHCFYWACLKSLEASEDKQNIANIIQLRNAIADYQLKHKGRFESAWQNESLPPSITSLEEYVEHMKEVKEGESIASDKYAGELEIKALHSMSVKPIAVIEKNRPVYVYGDEKSIAKANENQFICLLRSGGNHYDAYKPAKGMNLTATLYVLQALGLQIKYLSINQEFNSLCEAVLDAAPQLKESYSTRKEFQEAIHESHPTLDKEDMSTKNRHFFALSRQLKCPIAVFEGAPEKCIYYRSESEEALSIRAVVKEKSIEKNYYGANSEYSQKLDSSEVLGGWQKKLNQPVPVIMVQFSNGRYTKREQAGKPQALTLNDLQKRLARSKENSKQSSNIGKQVNNEKSLDALCKILHSRLVLLNQSIVKARTNDTPANEKRFATWQELKADITNQHQTILKTGITSSVLGSLQKNVVYPLAVLEVGADGTKKCTVYFMGGENGEESKFQEIDNINKLPQEAQNRGGFLFVQLKDGQYTEPQEGLLTKDGLGRILSGGSGGNQSAWEWGKTSGSMLATASGTALEKLSKAVGEIEGDIDTAGKEQLDQRIELVFEKLKALEDSDEKDNLSARLDMLADRVRDGLDSDKLGEQAPFFSRP